MCTSDLHLHARLIYAWCSPRTRPRRIASAVREEAVRPARGSAPHAETSLRRKRLTGGNAPAVRAYHTRRRSPHRASPPRRLAQAAVAAGHDGREPAAAALGPPRLHTHTGDDPPPPARCVHQNPARAPPADNVRIQEGVEALCRDWRRPRPWRQPRPKHSTSTKRVWKRLVEIGDAPARALARGASGNRRGLRSGAERTTKESRRAREGGLPPGRPQRRGAGRQTWTVVRSATHY